MPDKKKAVGCRQRSGTADGPETFHHNIDPPRWDSSIDILVIIDGLCGRGSWSEHRDQLLGVNNLLKEMKMRM